MTYSIVYTSNTGNTALLAEKIRDTLPPAQCQYFGPPTPAAGEAELLFIGFWTDKGNCSEDMAAFLKDLVGKKIFLFGTAGFGGAETYFDQILQRVAAHLAQGNQIIGAYMCQGKMPASVGARYAALAEQEPEKGNRMLENFNRALTHPDADDLEHLGQRVAKLTQSLG